MATNKKNLTGDEWTQKLLEDPSQADRCTWSKLDGTNWADLLSKMPKFAKQCKKTIDKEGNEAWKKLKGSDWASLLSIQPKFAKQCDATVDKNKTDAWTKLNGSDWAKLLLKSKQSKKFETVCSVKKAWGKLKGVDWITLLLKHPQRFEKVCTAKKAWGKLNGTDWSTLLSECPQFAQKCDDESWEKLNGTDWAKLLARQPQLANDRDKLVKWRDMDGRCWAYLLEALEELIPKKQKESVLLRFRAKCDKLKKWEEMDEWSREILRSCNPDYAAKFFMIDSRTPVLEKEETDCSKDGERTEIVLNRMFNGGYLDDNIGHEIINMFKDDHGANYIYILPWGGYASCHYGKIGWVVLTRLVPKREALEVLALATGLQDVYEPEKGHGPDQWKNQKIFLEKNQVTYGNAKLVDILGNGSETAGLKQEVWISMRAKSVLRPTRPVFIVFGSNDTIEDKDAPNHYSICLKNTNRARQSQKQYLKPDDTDYDKLKKELVDNELLWDDKKSTSKIGAVDPSKITEDNFFDICGIADRELAFSDALAYFFRKYPSLATFVLGQPECGSIKLSEDFDCLREWENIDLLLEDERQIVVIENKILSSINGIKMTDEGVLSGSQLDKYWEIAEKRAKGECLDDEDSLKLFLARHPKKVSGLILTPKYSRISLDDYNLLEKKPKFVCKDHYRHVTYEVFYKSFWDYMEKKVPNDRYFLELLKGMEPHTDKQHNDLFKRMKNQFLKRIGDVKRLAYF